MPLPSTPESPVAEQLREIGQHAGVFAPVPTENLTNAIAHQSILSFPGHVG